MDPQNIDDKQKEIESYYDDFSKKQINTGVNKRHHSILDKFKQSGLKSNHDVLELGCGIGTFTGLLVNELNEGSVVAMDISNESIVIANKSHQRHNLKFIHADVTNYDFDRKGKFDAIVLPDVLEHIPIELHDKLFQKLSTILKEDGFIFIHIPNPYFLEWCHINRPDLLQVIDQPITTDILIQNSYPHGFFIDELKTYPLWIKDNDYQYIVLKKKGYQNFSEELVYNATFLEKLKYKLKNLKK